MVVFVAHSIFWWLGIFGSFGLARVLIPVVPLIAIIAVKGLNKIVDHLKRPLIKKLTIVLILTVVICYPFTTYREKSVIFDRTLFSDVENQLVYEEVAPYIKKEFDDDEKLVFYYGSPNLSLYLDLDHFDPDIHQPFHELFISDVPDGAIVIWDNWFCRAEESAELDDLLQNPNFKKLKTFKRTDRMKTVKYVVFRAELGD